MFSIFLATIQRTLMKIDVYACLIVKMTECKDGKTNHMTITCLVFKQQVALKDGGNHRSSAVVMVM